MRIAQLAPPFERVPPLGYGGTERVIATLTNELVRRGHQVTLFASGDSGTEARLVPVVERALWHQGRIYGSFEPFWTIALGAIAARLDEFDVVHSHLDYHGFPLARLAPIPVVTTCHGRLDLPELQPLFRAFPDVPVVSISDAQRTPIPGANWQGTVYNGIDLDEYTFEQRPGDYLVFLGRISPEKGVDTAIHIARRAGVPLKIAARLPLPFTQDPGIQRDWDYYHSAVEPLLGGPEVEMLGEVSGADKAALLRGAAALLFPINWPEPFGLVVAEAFACGTPVLALRHGSVPELITDGVTGFIGDDEDDLVRAVARIGELDRRRCREMAERRFSPAAMTDGYLAIYERLRRERCERLALATPVPGPLERPYEEPYPTHVAADGGPLAEPLPEPIP